MEKILNIKPLEDYLIAVETSSVTGVFDVKPYLNFNVFKALKNKGYFNSVVATKYGIEWQNGQDFSSDTIIFDIKNQ
ncbi:hypothetical protein SPONN_73 [uncultured Candidatus Thioglobus sp.]|nr:hypothetical protein SPONN_73 [uncultured Candidatus Thioglobus sp.]SMM99918.1 hypothetical protein SPONL_986 [uncultured Candidatus Thioglobus sp.]